MIKNIWPNIKKDLQEEIKIAAQVNGKTRVVINVKKDLNQKQIEQILENDPKLKKYIDNKIFKTIFVKNKIINYIIR